MSTTLPPWNPATSDGCSIPALLKPFFHITPEQRKACVRHDRAYYYGGTKEDRLIADATLMIEWLRAGMTEEQAQSGFEAIRLGGGPEGRKPYSWAFGGKRFVYDSKETA
jgi:hypothetical protein